MLFNRDCLGTSAAQNLKSTRRSLAAISWRRCTSLSTTKATAEGLRGNCSMDMFPYAERSNANDFLVEA
jgi:hypothetical protein